MLEDEGKMVVMEEASTSTADVEMDDLEEQEGEEEIEDGEYTFRFEGHMNPLDFTDNDAFGVHPYQKFEEFEALAERKRKALSNCQNDESAKKPRQEDFYVTEFDKIQKEMMSRKQRMSKKRGRRKGSKGKLSPEITRKLGEANLYYAKRQYEEAIHVLNEVIVLAPNLSESYHTCGLVYEEIGNKKKAMNFYMIAALVAPKEHQYLWKQLMGFSIEQGNTGQAIYCLSRAIRADPEDMALRFDHASLYIELGDYKKAAESYDHIVGLRPENVEARKMAAMMHQKCGQVAHAVSILEDYLKNHETDADWSLVDLLVAISMKNNAHAKALQQIEHICSVHCNGDQLPLYLTVKAGICHVHLGNVEEAEILFRDLRMKHAEDNTELITEVANSFMNLGYYESALKYYLLLEGIDEPDNGFLLLKIAQCYLSVKEKILAITYFYKALHKMEDNIDARLTLGSLLLEEQKQDEAIALLSAPKHIISTADPNCVQPKPWWSNGKVQMQLAQIYHDKGMLEDFVRVILSSVSETLDIERSNQKVRRSKRTPRCDLLERVEVFDKQQANNIYRSPLLVTQSVRLQLKRAKKLLQKHAAIQEEKKASVLAAGLDWRSDDSDEESLRQAPREPPLPKLLKDDEHYQLILDLCMALTSLRRYSEALGIITESLKLAGKSLPLEKTKVLHALGVQIAINTNDPKIGYNFAREVVMQEPYSFAAWNYYYKFISRLVSKCSRHSKFLHKTKCTLTDCVPPRIILGHQLTMISQHQAAAREYLEAYKLQPDNSLINVCVGTALINLALGHRLQNKLHCLAQGFAFLYNSLRLCKNSQESLYNIGRACQHVGLVAFAVVYYEKVLTLHEKDYPIPKPLNVESNLPKTHKQGNYRDLRREAAYNLHLIYKKSGAVDLARQVLRNHCTP